MDRNDAVFRVARNVHGPEVVSGTASGLIESCDELSGSRNLADVRPRKVLEKNVVADDVGEAGGGGTVGKIGGAEEGVGNSEEGERRAVDEIAVHGGGGYQVSEVR